MCLSASSSPPLFRVHRSRKQIASPGFYCCFYPDSLKGGPRRCTRRASFQSEVVSFSTSRAISFFVGWANYAELSPLGMVRISSVVVRLETWDAVIDQRLAWWLLWYLFFLDSMWFRPSFRHCTDVALGGKISMANFASDWEFEWLYTAYWVLASWDWLFLTSNGLMLSCVCRITKSISMFSSSERNWSNLWRLIKRGSGWRTGSFLGGTNEFSLGKCIEFV